MLQPIVGNYYILSRSDDIGDAIKVVRVYEGTNNQGAKQIYSIDYEYVVKIESNVRYTNTGNIHIKAFRACYREHVNMNILYAKRK